MRQLGGLTDSYFRTRVCVRVQRTMFGGLEDDVVEPLEDLGGLELVRRGRVEEHIRRRPSHLQITL